MKQLVFTKKVNKRDCHHEVAYHAKFCKDTNIVDETHGEDD